MARTLKYSILAFILLLVSALIYMIIYIFPHHKSAVIPVVIYQLDGDEVREAELRIDGTLRRSLFGEHSFHGYFNIDDDWFQIPDEYTYIELDFHDYKPTMFGYTIFSERGLVNHIFVGQLFTDSNFSTHTILLNYVDGESTAWTSESGFVLSAPANDREEAIRLTNALVKDYYVNWNILSQLE